MEKLAKAQAKREHKRPTLEIEPHDSAYYQDDAPKISDAECDAPRLRFNAIEARFPEFVSLLDFRFAAHCGPKSDIAPCRESAATHSITSSARASYLWVRTILPGTAPIQHDPDLIPM